MVDTLRADRLDLYGYRRPTAPHLAELARSGIVLREARSQAACTYPSVNSMLTSRWPQHFLNRQDAFGFSIPDDTPALAEILAARGYSTAAVSASWIVRKTPSKINPGGGFGRGFQTFDESCLERPGDCVNAQAEALLDRLPQPFFLYLQYLDTHQPYRLPAGYTKRLATNLRGHPWALRGDVQHLTRGLYDRDPRSAFDADDVETLRDLYDEKIAYFDERLAELMARLQRGGLMETTIVVLLSDHGEELLDHGQWGHCRDIAYETVLRTPFVLWVPGGPHGIERSGLARDLDLVPTLLDLLHLPYDPKAFAGTSLRPLFERDPDLPEISFALQGTNRVASDGRYKVWLDLAGGPPRVYDLRIGEHTPAINPDRPAVNRLAQALREWIEREEGQTKDGNLRRARENEMQLKALGYL